MLKMLQRSSMRFSMGVPVSAHLKPALSILADLARLVWAFLRAWASSSTSMDHSTLASSSSMKGSRP